MTSDSDDTTDELEVPDLGEPRADPAIPGPGPGPALAARALRSLPERWRAVLWPGRLDEATAARIAERLRGTESGAADLSHRALDALRAAYLRMYLDEASRPECRPAAGKLGRLARRALSRRDTRLVSRHVGGCAQCGAIYADLVEMEAVLRGVIAPRVLGGGPGASRAATRPADPAPGPSREACVEPSREAGEELSRQAAGEPPREARVEPSRQAAGEPSREARVEPSRGAAGEPSRQAAAEPSRGAVAAAPREVAPAATREVARPATWPAVTEPPRDRAGRGRRRPAVAAAAALAVIVVAALATVVILHSRPARSPRHPAAAAPPATRAPGSPSQRPGSPGPGPSGAASTRLARTSGPRSPAPSGRPGDASPGESQPAGSTPARPTASGTPGFTPPAPSPGPPCLVLPPLRLC
jgi:hypothetical protein